MGTKTICLEDSAHERLKAAKRPGESFSDVVRRIRGSPEPSLLEFTELLDRRAAEAVAEAVAHIRKVDLAVQRRRLRTRP